MSPNPTQPPFAPGAQGQPAGQAAQGKTSWIARHMVERHDALYRRIEPLARQADTVAAKTPLKAVPDDLRLKVEAALYESHAFCQQRRASLTPAAPHFGALATQLGAVLTQLIAFEARHTRWDRAIKAQVWLVEGKTALPVRRLHPKLAAGPTPEEAAAHAARMAEIRIKLAKRIDEYNRR